MLIVAASDGNELEAAELLAAVGLRVRGFLGGGMSAWRAEERPVSRIEAIDPAGLAALLDGADPPLVVDVRGAGEFEAGHIPGSVHIPYAELAAAGRRAAPRPPGGDDLQGGKRSGLAASILQREGFDRDRPRLDRRRAGLAGARARARERRDAGGLAARLSNRADGGR